VWLTKWYCASGTKVLQNKNPIFITIICTAANNKKQYNILKTLADLGFTTK
jgi:hypothetical protein